MDACSSSRNVAYHFKTDFINNKVIHNYKTVDSWNEEIIEENTWIQGAGKVYAFNVPTYHFNMAFDSHLSIALIHMYRVLYLKALDFIWKFQTECRGVADYHWNPANTRNSILRKSFSLLDFVQVFVFSKPSMGIETATTTTYMLMLLLTQCKMQSNIEISVLFLALKNIYVSKQLKHNY